MFNAPILEVVIGLAFVYLILSMICSAVNEWIASRLDMRAKHLEKVIKNIFENFKDPENKAIKKFYEHPLIKSLMDSEKKPSYIPSNTFALAFLNAINYSDTFEKANDSISKLPEGEMKKVLLNFCNLSQNDIVKVQKDIEDWFNSAMERVSGWYKRKTQWIILGISFGVCGFLNVDSFMIANTLWHDDSLRASIVASAQVAAKNPTTSDTSAKPKSIEELSADLQKLNLPIGWVRQHDTSSDFRENEFVSPLTKEELWRVINEDKYNVTLKATVNTIDWLNELLECPNFYDILNKNKPKSGFSENIKDLVDKTKCYRNKNFSDLKINEQNNIKRLNRLLVEETYPRKTPKSQLINDPGSLPGDLWGWIYKAFGIIFTVLAVSQGAPFWFDLLNKFVNLRGAGKKPDDEKEKKK